MGFFDFLSGSGSPEVQDYWNVLTSEEEADKILDDTSGLHIIYKHSFSCSISVMSHRSIEQVIPEFTEKATFSFVDVKKDRPVSQYIAKKTGVQHQSPQIIVLRNGEVFWEGSHGSVTGKALKEIFDELS